MTSGTVSSIFLLLLSCTPALAQTQSAQFNQVLNINGDMILNSFQFPDRSKVETFSQKQQQLIVNQQTPAVPANQVTGSTGQPFVAMMAQSMSISTNGASNLVGGQIELAIDPQMLATNAVNPDNTWVAMLSPDRQTWMIQETMRSINATDMTVRMIKRTTLDGEYMALGRQTVETNAMLTPFGSDGASTVAIQGTGLQENEFQDGFRMSTRATQPMTMNVDVKDGIDTSMLAALSGQEPVNDFRYSVVTNLAAVQPDLNRQVTVVQMPLNPQRLQQMMSSAGIGAGGQVALSVAKRDVLQNPGGATGNLNLPAGAPARRSRIFGRQVQAGQPAAGVPQAGTPTTNNQNPVAQQLLLAPTFTPIQANLVLDTINMRVAFPVSAVDGEYIITMQTGAAGQQPQAEAPAAPQPGQQPGQTPPTPEGQGQAQPQPGQAPPTPEQPGQQPPTPEQPGQAPPTPEGQLQPTNGTAPTAGEPKAPGEAPKAEGEAPKREGEAPKPEGEAPKPEGEAPKAEAPKAEGNSTTPAAGEAPKKPERRQEASQPAIGDKPPQGSVYITKKEVDQMAQLWQWGGQAPISQMMEEFVGNATKA